MELLIIFVWLALVIAVFPVMISVAYYLFVRGANMFEVTVRLISAFIAHALVTGLFGFPMVGTLFIGAHSEPAGNVLSWEGKSVLITIVLIHALIGWLLCSFVALKFIGIPRRISATFGNLP